MLDPSQFLSDFGLRSLSRGLRRRALRLRRQSRRLRAGRVGLADLRRQLQLAGADLVPGQLPDDRGAAGVSIAITASTLTVELPRGRAGPGDARRGRRRDRRATDADLPPRRPDGRRPVLGDVALFQSDPHWRDLVPFYEYFHGDNGSGLGASHQTGWTALVAELITADRWSAVDGRTRGDRR